MSLSELTNLGISEMFKHPLFIFLFSVGIIGIIISIIKKIKKK
jgi:hypothetical protein